MKLQHGTNTIKYSSRRKGCVFSCLETDAPSLVLGLHRKADSGHGGHYQGAPCVLLMKGGAPPQSLARTEDDFLPFLSPCRKDRYLVAFEKMSKRERQGEMDVSQAH